MLLIELTSPSKLPIDPEQADNLLNASSDLSTQLNAFTKLMKTKGFRAIGKGAFARVYVHPDYDYVIKVFSSAAGYIDFLRFCETHRDNPHLPRIRGKAKRIGGNFYCVRMERLKPVGNDVGHFLEEVKSAIYKSSKYADYETILRNCDAPRAALERTGLDEQMVMLIAELRQLRPYSLDINTKNMMRRGKTLVIIDPFAD